MKSSGRFFNALKVFRTREQLQKELEAIALKINDGLCESYNICEYCAEPRTFDRVSKTPCLDAFEEMQKDMGYDVELKSNKGGLHRTWKK